VSNTWAVWYVESGEVSCEFVDADSADEAREVVSKGEVFAVNTPGEIPIAAHLSQFFSSDWGINGGEQCVSLWYV